MSKEEDFPVCCLCMHTGQIERYVSLSAAEKSGCNKAKILESCETLLIYSDRVWGYDSNALQEIENAT
jgi:hypothetical protein